MTQTPNYDLNLFDSNDDMEENSRLGLNDNADKIDTALKDIQDEVDGLSSPAAADVTYDNTVSGLTATDVQAALDEELGKIDILFTDYIVEEGTDGIWTYEKWNSGKAVCWGTYAATGISATAWGNQYTANIGAVNFPTGLFTTTPTVCLATPVAGYAGAICYNGTDGLTQNHTQGIQFVRPTTVSNASFSVSFYAIGKWK